MEIVPAVHRWARWIALACTGVLVLMLADWVLSDPRVNLETDWTAFDNAAERVVTGEEIYRPYDAEAEPLPYLYPPFALPLSLPLATVGFYGSLLLSAVGTFVAFVGGLMLFARSEQRPFDATTGIIVATASGSVVSSTLIGQYSGLYVLAFGLAAWLWSANRTLLAGVALALLWIKPNLAIAVPVALVWSRSWPALRGFALGSCGLVLVSLPFGVAGWQGFLSNVRMMTELQRDDVVPFEKMVTVLGGAHTTFGFGSESPAALLVFSTTALVLGLAVLALWTPRALEQSHLRAFGGLAVFVVVANPRLYFYDSTLVAMGMFGLWAAAHTVGGALAKQWLPVIGASTWLLLWGGLFAGLNRGLGVIAGAGLVASALDARRGVHAATETQSPDIQPPGKQGDGPVHEPSTAAEGDHEPLRNAA